MLRIPLAGGRVECRAADISSNFYLGAAMMLAAGLEGIREGLDPGAPHTENMYLVPDEELRRRGISWLPRTLDEAVDAFEADPLSRQVMGDGMFRAFADFKRREWIEYHTEVSEWEHRRYLRLF
jgi:glutamine synthetase